MPLYEFYCNKCALVFEVLVRSAADEKGLTCPHCANKKVVKQFSIFRTGGGCGNSGVDTGGKGGGCHSCGGGTCSTCG